MGKIKKWYRSIPIWFALFLFIVSAMLAASFVSNKVTSVFNMRSVELQLKYATITQVDVESGNSGITYKSYGKDGLDNLIEIELNYERYSDKDWQLYQVYRFILGYSPFFIYSFFVLIMVLLFYFTKLKTPMKMLTKASARIADNELDFNLNYSGYDEMAKLCAAFEKMRSALQEKNTQMLHMIDERKQLNDAYTHDLRTPIAVLKGYTDMLTKYLPAGKMSQEEVVETVKTMSAHVSRLEQFVDSMNTVQKLEDVSIQKTAVVVQEFLDHLRESADIICESKGLSCTFHTSVCGDSLFLDPAAVIQVYENLISNAVRFAKSEVMVNCGVTEDMFSISVADDGKGFSDKDLWKAIKPYYSNDTQKQEYHFGLGLHICRILCEKHGGKLQVKNAANGGASVTAVFSTR